MGDPSKLSVVRKAAALARASPTLLLSLELLSESSTAQQTVASSSDVYYEMANSALVSSDVIMNQEGES